MIMLAIGGEETMNKRTTVFTAALLLALGSCNILADVSASTDPQSPTVATPTDGAGTSSDAPCTTNPASGLPMSGGCSGHDSAGNAYGDNSASPPAPSDPAPVQQ
jgi:hypothetical protein